MTRAVSAAFACLALVSICAQAQARSLAPPARVSVKYSTTARAQSWFPARSKERAAVKQAVVHSLPTGTFSARVSRVTPARCPGCVRFQVAVTNKATGAKARAGFSMVEAPFVPSGQPAVAAEQRFRFRK